MFGIPRFRTTGRQAFGIAIIGLALGVSGCASLVYRAPDFRGTLRQDVQVTSEPTAATVRLNGIIVGVTPTRVAVRRKESGQSLTFEKDGYMPQVVSLKRRMSGAAVGNVALSGVPFNPLNGLSDNPWSRSQQVAVAFVLPALGLGIDLASGAAFAVPSRVHVTLALESPDCRVKCTPGK